MPIPCQHSRHLPQFPDQAPFPYAIQSPGITSRRKGSCLGKLPTSGFGFFVWLLPTSHARCCCTSPRCNLFRCISALLCTLHPSRGPSTCRARRQPAPQLEEPVDSFSQTCASHLTVHCIPDKLQFMEQMAKSLLIFICCSVSPATALNSLMQHLGMCPHLSLQLLDFGSVTAVIWRVTGNDIYLYLAHGPLKSEVDAKIRGN